MKTVYDLMRHHTPRNYGMMKPINELHFVCSLCPSQRYRLRLVPDHRRREKAAADAVVPWHV